MTVTVTAECRCRWRVSADVEQAARAAAVREAQWAAHLHEERNARRAYAHDAQVTTAAPWRAVAAGR